MFWNVFACLSCLRREVIHHITLYMTSYPKRLYWSRTALWGPQIIQLCSFLAEGMILRKIVNFPSVGLCNRDVFFPWGTNRCLQVFRMNFRLRYKFTIFSVILSTNLHLILSSYVPRFLLSFLSFCFIFSFYCLHTCFSSIFLLSRISLIVHFSYCSYVLTFLLCPYLFILLFLIFFVFLSFCPLLKQNASKIV